MGLALWIGYGLACAVIGVIVLAAALRPYVDALRAERDGWQRRALDAEGRAGRDDPYEGMRLLPENEIDDDPLGIWTKGLEP